MIMKIVILLIMLVIFIIYLLYFKDYFRVKKVYNSLRNFLDVRDSLIIKLISEIENKKVASKIVNLIEERRENFKTSYNNSIKADAKLNSALKEFYESLNSMKKNEVVNSTFAKSINLEKDLKKIRVEYNNAVEKYNQNLVKHKFVCLRVIKMKPLDTYKVVPTVTANGDGLIGTDK